MPIWFTDLQCTQRVTCIHACQLCRSSPAQSCAHTEDVVIACGKCTVQIVFILITIMYIEKYTAQYRKTHKCTASHFHVNKILCHNDAVRVMSLLVICLYACMHARSIRAQLMGHIVSKLGFNNHEYDGDNFTLYGHVVYIKIFACYMTVLISNCPLF